MLPLPTRSDVRAALRSETETTVQVSSSPVQTATSVTALGELEEVGQKFATSRKAELLSSYTRDADDRCIIHRELNRGPSPQRR